MRSQSTSIALLFLSLVLQQHIQSPFNANFKANADTSASYNGGGMPQSSGNWRDNWRNMKSGAMDTLMLKKAGALKTGNAKLSEQKTEVEALKRDAEQKRQSVRIIELTELTAMAQNQKLLLKEAYGSIPLAALLGELPLDVAKSEIESLPNNTDALPLEMVTDAKAVVLTLKPAKKDSGVESEDLTSKSDETDADHFESKHGIIDSLLLNALSETRGVIFTKKSICKGESDSEENGLNILKVPKEHATFEVLQPGIQKVVLDRTLDLDLNSELVIIMSTTSDAIVPIAIDKPNVTQSGAQDTSAANSHLEGLSMKIEEMRGTVMEANYDPELGAYHVIAEQFEREETFQMFLAPVIELIDLSDVLMISKNGSPQMILTDGLKTETPSVEDNLRPRFSGVQTTADGHGLNRRKFQSLRPQQPMM
ncbi:MAG: hypothetical protein MHMPM18_001428 [Marteilia pararefringens]